MKVFNLILLLFIFAMPLTAQRSDTDSLRHRLEELGEQKRVLSRQIETMVIKLRAAEKTSRQYACAAMELEREIAELEMFRGEAELHRVLTTGREACSLSFSRLSVDELQQMRCVLSSNEAEGAGLMRRIDATLKNKERFEAYRALLSSPFDAVRIDEARDWCDAMRNDTIRSEVQWQEIDDLDRYLSRYEGGLTRFQSLIKEVDAVVADNLAEEVSDEIMEKTRQLVKECVDKSAEEIAKRIPYVPYLRVRYDRYIELILENPYMEDEELLRIRLEIKNMKVR